MNRRTITIHGPLVFDDPAEGEGHVAGSAYFENGVLRMAFVPMSKAPRFYNPTTEEYGRWFLALMGESRRVPQHEKQQIVMEETMVIESTGEALNEWNPIDWFPCSQPVPQ